SRIEGEHLDGGIVHLGQRGDGQLRVGYDAGQENRGHRERGRDRPQNKLAGRVHREAFRLEGGGAGLATVTGVWSCNFSKPEVTTWVPAESPSTAVIPPSVAPILMLVTCAWPLRTAYTKAAWPLC